MSEILELCREWNMSKQSKNIIEINNRMIEL